MYCLHSGSVTNLARAIKLLATKDSLPAKKPKHLFITNLSSSLKSDFTFVCLDNVEGSVPMEDFIWPENTLMIFGEEGIGLSDEILSMADHVVSITQYGSVRSMNVGTTSGIAMYDYINKLNG